MVKNLPAVLAFAYPQANQPFDAAAAQEGDSVIISRWNVQKLGPQPTLETLELIEQSPAYLDAQQARQDAASVAAKKAAAHDAFLSAIVAGKPDPIADARLAAQATLVEAKP